MKNIFFIYFYTAYKIFSIQINILNLLLNNWLICHVPLVLLTWGVLGSSQQNLPSCTSPSKTNIYNFQKE